MVSSEVWGSVRCMVVLRSWTSEAEGNVMDVFSSVRMSHNICAKWSLNICLIRTSETSSIYYLGIYFIFRLI